MSTPTSTPHPLPTWLRNHLQTTGALDHEGRGRRARATHCTGCGTITLVGYDGDTCARLCTVDPVPLSALGEALALVGGRYTATLQLTRKGLEIWKRDSTQIPRRPAAADGNWFDVVAEHRCGYPPLPSAPSYRPDTKYPTYPSGSPAPF